MSVASYQQQQQQHQLQRSTINNNIGGGGSCYSNNNNNNYAASDVANGNGATGSVRLAGDNTKDRMYEPKHNQKAMRVLTVIAYIFFVSLAAIMLSLYYVFLWNPPPPPQPSKMMTLISGINFNITDCNHGVMNGHMAGLTTQPLETPKAMPIINNNNNNNEDNNAVISTTEMNNNVFNSNATIEDNTKETKENFTIDTADVGGENNNYNNNDNDNSYYL